MLRALSHTAIALWALFALQAFAALFFLADITLDFLEREMVLGWAWHLYVEFVATVVLVVSMTFTGVEIRRVLARQEYVEAQLRAASGAFHEVLRAHFEDWALTPSERDVAMLAVKGLSITEIARVRETKEGTIKAQCNAIYRKAGVTGRPQLLSLFVDELMGDGLTGSQAKEMPSISRKAPTASKEGRGIRAEP